LTCVAGEEAMKTLAEIKKILSAHKEELAKKYKIKELGIFGSFVRGEQRKRSDIDILVDFEEVPDLLTFIEIEIYIEKLIGIKTDLVRRPALRPELKDRILNEVVSI